MWWRYIIARPFFAHLAKGDKYKLEVEGTENVPKHGPFIVIANHQTGEDAFFAAVALKPPLYHNQMLPWAKKEIGEGKEGFKGWILWRLFGKISIDRDITNLEEPIKQSQEQLAKGNIIFIHPEGTRYPDGELGPFYCGAPDLIRSLHPFPIPILPVAVYRRKETDGGLTAIIGKPFILPRRHGQEFLENHKDELMRSSDRIKKAYDRYIREFEKWSESIPEDKKSIRVLTKSLKKVAQELEKKDFDFFKKACKMADKKDTEYMEDRVLELLPDYFKKVKNPNQ